MSLLNYHYRKKNSFLLCCVPKIKYPWAKQPSSVPNIPVIRVNTVIRVNKVQCSLVASCDDEVMF